MKQTGKQIGIVELLEWAYRHELPKAERAGAGMSASVASSWGLVYNLGILGTVIDAPTNGYGVVPVSFDEGDPHPDAVIVGEAVAALSSLGVWISDGWSPFPEWADTDGLVAETVARIRPRLAAITGQEIQTMLIARAVLGRKPDWRGEEPGRAMITRGGKPAWFMKMAGKDAYGNPVEREVDGFNPRSQRPKPGAYRKYRLTDDVEGLAIDRFRRTVWALAVRHVARYVAAWLSSHQLTAEVPTLAPWAAVAGLEGQGDPPHAVSLFS
ncbi:hypothetical protein HPDFL43_05770 [Hoeflea phototrophica DFL-43]|jgi:hypothetical protein|uniref:Uncharacterized protein n=1 Tax=Hoeflea phototrophica (strain DSM 17068 / NCIMB 14078 / DFL-43) TaxID=411684 RepID=A9D4Q7_HOEPD|nr:hypothetical protein [Hoeflea phototrophica]EDQ33937.1 hypothetical protein HPDFL43_05770 [Hoeflea phototrophica DFL-43]